MALKTVVMAVVCAATLAVAAKAMADQTPKYLVNHKGNLQCVDEDSLSAHYGHGDPYTDIVCAE